MSKKINTLSIPKYPLILVRVEQILIVLGLVILFTQMRFWISGDAFTRYLAVESLIDKGKLSAMPYSFIGPLFSVPFFLLGKFAADARVVVVRFNFVIFVLGLFFLNHLLRDYLESSIRRKFFLILIFGSMFPHHLADYYGEVFTAILVASGVLAVTTEKYPKLGWTAIILGVANIPASVIGLGFIILAFCLKKKRWRYIFIFLIVAVIFFAENWIRRGSPFITGYENNWGLETFMPYSGLAGFSYPLLFGLLSLLLSFGKGIVFFIPGIFLPVRKHMQSFKQKIYFNYKLWIWFVVGLILIYAKWWAWYGGWLWGPRFFLFASIPASLALAIRLSSSRVSLLDDLITLLALTLSFWVGINGAVFGLSTLENLTKKGFATEAYSWYIPEFSPLWRPFVVLKQLSTAEIIIIVFITAVFIYLAVPLVFRMGRSILAEWKKFKTTYFTGKKWRL